MCFYVTDIRPDNLISIGSSTGHDQHPSQVWRLCVHSKHKLSWNARKLLLHAIYLGWNDDQVV